MFCVLSKLFWFVAAPTNAFLALCILGVLVTFTRWQKTSHALLVLGATGLILIGTTPLPRAIVRPLEDRFPQNTNLATPVTGIIVLGGTIGMARGQVRFTEGAARLTTAVALARSNREDRKSTRLNSSHRNTSRMPSSA